MTRTSKAAAGLERLIAVDDVQPKCDKETLVKRKPPLTLDAGSQVDISSVHQLFGPPQMCLPSCRSLRQIKGEAGDLRPASHHRAWASAALSISQSTTDPLHLSSDTKCLQCRTVQCVDGQGCALFSNASWK